MNAQDELNAIRTALLDEMGITEPDQWTTMQLLDAIMGDKHAAEGMATLHRKQWKRQNQDALSMHGKLDRLGFAVERIAEMLKAQQPRNERADPVPEFNVGDPAYLPAHLVRQRGYENADYHGTIDSRILRKNAWWEYTLEGSAGAFIVNEADLRRPRHQPALEAQQPALEEPPGLSWEKSALEWRAMFEDLEKRYRALLSAPRQQPAPASDDAPETYTQALEGVIHDALKDLRFGLLLDAEKRLWKAMFPADEWYPHTQPAPPAPPAPWADARDDGFKDAYMALRERFNTLWVAANRAAKALVDGDQAEWDEVYDQLYDALND